MDLQSTNFLTREKTFLFSLFAGGNIPSHVFYGSVMSEFLRIARSTLLYSDFLPVARSLFKRMLNQGGSQVKLLNQIGRALNRHPSAFCFNKSASQIVADISSD